ncbi:MAG TPA: 2-hydroxyacid dehydrogenase [Salinimicrobium sp.]|nr:2-hydroxyacid dehydrogenase [Salinimicrobium sp.]
MTILHADSNHPSLIQKLKEAGFTNIEGYNLSKEEILDKIYLYDGIVIRSRFKIDKDFISLAPKLKFIARVGAGMENIDVEWAKSKDIALFSAPEGNRNAVAEHALGMLLSLFNKFHTADAEIRDGHWNREANRGVELDGKTVGIIGYGNTGKAFAKKLKGFDVEVLCTDILENVGDENATQVPLEELQGKAEVVSLHTPLTEETVGMVNRDFIEKFANPFWLINTARGKSVVTTDLVKALQSKKILGAALDVLEYEKTSFEDLFIEKEKFPDALRELLLMNNVIFSPHVAGWTLESHQKLADTIAGKIIGKYGNRKKGRS